ncbi:MAG: hypothetical protein KC733_12635 [Candidatus Omnitrophica bacterium]|nr:hypothetical protein [Candidatus Omnitrophota bacterium]
MKERTSTTRFTLKPEGHYVLTVLGVPEKRSSGKANYRIWKFHYIKAGFDAEMSIIMFPWKSKELLLAVGGKEVENEEVEWDDELVNGKQISCDLIHEEDKEGVMRECLINIKPFNEPASYATQENKSWDE